MIARLRWALVKIAWSTALAAFALGWHDAQSGVVFG